MGDVSSMSVWMLSVGLTTLSAFTARAFADHVNARSRARRLADRTRLSSIADIRDGETVKITGRVAYADPPLEAPFSGRPCTHFEAAVASRNTHGYRKRVSTERTGNFWLKDDSGRVYVDCDRALIDVVHDHHWTSAEMELEERFELERHLYQHGPTWTRLLTQREILRYSEGALIEDDVVTVVGVASTTHDPELIHYRDLPRRISLTAPKWGRLFVSDGLHLQ